MLRETQFLVGGGLTIALGASLIGLLVWAGAGFDYFGGYLGSGLAVGFGAFFVYVGRSERRERAPLLVAPELPPPPSPPGPGGR
jgi:hypothetical protein